MCVFPIHTSAVTLEHFTSYRIVWYTETEAEGKRVDVLFYFVLLYSILYCFVLADSMNDL